MSIQQIVQLAPNGFGLRRWARRRRSNAYLLLTRIRQFLFNSSSRALRGPGGALVVEKRTEILGINVFTSRSETPRLKVALLVDEFFGGWNTAIGGYGALARKYICKYIPDERIEVDLLLNLHDGNSVLCEEVDGIKLYRLPAQRFLRQTWFEKQAYSLFLSIEMTEPSFKIVSEFDSKIPLLYWIQDPRALTLYGPRFSSVQRLRDGDWAYLNEVTPWIQEMMRNGRVSFISQGESLSSIARSLYEIPPEVPIEDLPNPVELDLSYQLGVPPKDNKIIFLGRLEAQKRVWIVCEIAKLMPQYEFYVLGATGVDRDVAGNAKTLEPYRNPDGSSKFSNLHFTGHVDGQVKAAHIKTAKLLLNTSIWEGIPVSWLEALSYGTLIVSAFDRDDIVRRYGTFVGEIMGDGTDAVALGRFTDAIDYWMTHEDERAAAARSGIAFVRDRHSIATFVKGMREAIEREIQ